MMQVLRKNVKSILWVSAVIFVIAIFAGFGGAFLQTPPDLIAKVNGASLYDKTFQRLYYQYIENNRQNMDEAKQKTIKKEIIQNMIKEELLYQETKKYDTIVTRKEIINNIYSFPAFQKEGKFDLSHYFRVLKYNHITPEEFEKSIQRSLLITKLQNLFASGIKVTSKEIDYEYEYNKDKNLNIPEEKEKEEFRKFLLFKKQSYLLNMWIEQLTKNANTKIYMKEARELFKDSKT